MVLGSSGVKGTCWLSTHRSRGAERHIPLIRHKGRPWIRIMMVNKAGSDTAMSADAMLGKAYRSAPSLVHY